MPASYVATITSFDMSSAIATYEAIANSAITSATSYASSAATSTTFTYTPTVYERTETTTQNLASITRPSKPVLSFPTIERPSLLLIEPKEVSLVSVPEDNVDLIPLSLPSSPSGLDISPPVANFTLDLSTDYKIVPDYNIPSVPSLDSLNISSVLPSLSVIPFNLSLPTTVSLVPPETSFNPIISPYTSDISDQVKSKLISMLNNSTGITPYVEDAIWNRNTDRESKASKLAENTLLSERASRGFSRPTGSLYAALDSIIMESQAKLIEASREIAIKQAELEQSNLKQTITNILSLEEILFKVYTEAAQRTIEVAKYKQDISIELFKASVSVHDLEIKAYEIFTEAYKAKVSAELNKLEVIKLEIERERLKNESNEQKVKLYLATIDGVKANVELYNSDITRVSNKLSAESKKLEAYSQEIDNYSKVIQAKSLEYNNYSTLVSAERAKVDMNSQSVQQYATRVQAYSAKSEISMKNADLSYKREELAMQKYQADADFYIKSLQARQMAYQAAVDIYKGESEIYKSNIDYEVSKAGVNRSKIELDIANAKATADVSLKNAEGLLSAAVQSASVTQEGRKAAGNIHQALAQASLSAINLSMGANAQLNNSLQEQHDFTN